MDIDRTGEVVTFFSYKGGTGRTMALANVAWILASQRQAGPRRRLGPRVARASTGSSTRSSTTELSQRHRGHRPRHRVRAGGDHAAPRRGRTTGIEQFAQRRSRTRSSLRLGRSRTAACSTSCRPAGRTGVLARRSAGFDWDDFYDRLGGGALLRRDARRTCGATTTTCSSTAAPGSATSPVSAPSTCPDTVVDCFTLTTQSIDGAAAVARSIDERYREREIRILPVPMRVEDGEQEQAGGRPGAGPAHASRATREG